MRAMKDIQVRWTVQVQSDEGKTLKKPSEFLNRLISAAAAGEFDEISRLWTRVAEAARKGGASKSDLLTIGTVLTVSLREMGRARRIEPLAVTRQIALEGLARRKRERKIPDEERQEVRDLDHELRDQFPVPADRYREIAKRAGLKFRRVTYLCTGK